MWSFGVWDDHTVETSAHVDPGASVQYLNFAKEVDLQSSGQNSEAGTGMPGIDFGQIVECRKTGSTL